MIRYYVVMNQDINKDKTKEDLILKYRDDKFLAALPLKNFLDIDKYFSSPPKMPKKYNAVYTYRDYNKDKVTKNVIDSAFKTSVLLNCCVFIRKFHKRIHFL